MMRARPVVWVIAVIALMAVRSAHTQQRSTIDEAEALLRISDYAQATELFRRALDAARQTGAEVDIARALLGLAEATQRQGDAAAGRAHVDEALAIAERLGDDRLQGDAHLRLALIGRGSSRADAIASVQRAREFYERAQYHRGIGAATLRLAEFQTTDLDEQGRLFQQAAVSARAGGDRRLEGAALHTFGDRLFNAARYEESLDFLTRAAEAFQSAQATIDLGTVYNSLGRVYRAHGRLDEALKAQRAALELHRQGKEPFSLMQSLNAVSVVLQLLHDNDAAQVYLQEAIALANAMPANPGTLRARDFLLANWSALLSHLGEPEKAAAALEQVIAGGRDSFPSVRNTQLSIMYRALGRYQDALAAAERAVTLCGESVIDCIAAYNARSDSHAAAGDGAAAQRDLATTMERLEKLRAQLVPSDYFKQDFSTAYRRYYGSAIAQQVNAGLDRESLETAELARSRAFLDLLASRSIAPSFNQQPALPLTLRGSASSSGAASPLTTPALNADQLIAVAQRLKSTVLSYWVSDAETFIWVVKPNGEVHARRVSVTRAKLADLIQDTAPFAENSWTGTAVLREPTMAWRALHALLIAPVRSLLPAANGALLTVVPHDLLTKVSFAALQDVKGRYLLEDFTLHYAPAGALFQFTGTGQATPGRRGEMLMISDPDPAQPSSLDPPLPRLPGSRAEASAITRQLQANRVRSLSGAAASEAAVRELAPSRSILHFAAHTVVRDNDPFASYLSLARSSPDAESDGVLTAQDVYRLKLAADLVVLSACRSASGTIPGDGVSAFARAFVYAGAASLVASVWDVADEPSNRLLPAFYRAWFGGASKAAALRQAQLQLLADLRRGAVQVNTAVGPVPIPQHPLFWAGFVLFGEPD